jgi:hypothetical protein
MEPTQDDKASAAPVVSPPQPKPRSTFSRIAWGIFGLIAIAIGASQLYSAYKSFNVLPECDSKSAKDTMAGIYKEHNFEPGDYTSIKTVSNDKDHVVCNAVLPLPDGVNLIADYDFFWEGNTVKVKYSMHRKAP